MVVTTSAQSLLVSVYKATSPALCMVRCAHLPVTPALSCPAPHYTKKGKCREPLYSSRSTYNLAVLKIAVWRIFHSPLVILAQTASFSSGVPSYILYELCAHATLCHPASLFAGYIMSYYYRSTDVFDCPHFLYDVLQ